MTRSVMGLARVLAVAFGVLAVVETGRTLVATLWLAGVLPETATLLAWGATFLLVTLGTVALVPALAFFTWRTATNVLAREPDFYESPGGSAIAWFIPGWNLYKPYDALCSIWAATANLLPGDEPQGPGRLIEVFWVAWVLSIVVGRVFAGRADVLGLMDLVAAALSAASCIAGALVVTRLAKLQESVVAA